jgi:hypothetical protein
MMSDLRRHLFPDNAADAAAQREAQAEQMLREAGFAPDEDGNWHPIDEETT